MFEEYRVRRTAGTSAKREYERRKKAWHHRHRVFFRSSAIVVLVVYLGTFVFARHDLPAYFAGMVTGAALCGYVAIRESPPGWIENHLVGSWGEERTAKALSPLLKRGWVIVHDLNRFKSNLDHVLIGPGGVFVLDSKNMQGTAVVAGDQLTLTRPDETKPAYTSDGLAGQARGQGFELNRLLRQRCQLSPWVTAVIVLWSEFPQRAVKGRSMSFVHGDHLVEWLLAQPARLNAVQIEQIAAALQPGQRRRREDRDQATEASAMRLGS